MVLFLCELLFEFGPVVFGQDYAAAQDAAKECPDYQGLGAAVGRTVRNGYGLDDCQHRSIALNLKFSLLQLLGKLVEQVYF